MIDTFESKSKLSEFVNDIDFFCYVDRSENRKQGKTHVIMIQVDGLEPLLWCKVEQKISREWVFHFRQTVKWGKSRLLKEEENGKRTKHSWEVLELSFYSSHSTFNKNSITFKAMVIIVKYHHRGGITWRWYNIADSFPPQIRTRNVLIPEK